MMDYTYSPELKMPPQSVDFDLSRPGTLMMLKLLCKTHQKQTQAFVPPQGVTLRTVTLAGVPCFVAEPQTRDRLGAMLYCHGGAFYLPTQVSSLELACRYALQGQMRVFLPEYRLVPEYPAPAALEDCLAVWQELTQNAEAWSVDAQAMLIYGESAGGALAAGLCLYIRDHGLTKAAGQLMVYPLVDNRPERYASMQDYLKAAWSPRSNASMWEGYLRGTQDHWLPYIIPMTNPDFTQLPPAYVEPQQIDILRDEAIAYARQLEQAGCEVTLSVIPGSYHGFDADLSSLLVQRVLRQRLEIMGEMLNIDKKEG